MPTSVTHSINDGFSRKDKTEKAEKETRKQLPPINLRRKKAKKKTDETETRYRARRT